MVGDPVNPQPSATAGFRIRNVPMVQALTPGAPCLRPVWVRKLRGDSHTETKVSLLIRDAASSSQQRSDLRQTRRQ